MAPTLKARLDVLYRRALAEPGHFDPVDRVRRYGRPEDQEVVGLIAASLAYGRITQILASIDRVLSCVPDLPAAVLRDATYPEIERCLGIFRHRFTDQRSLALMLRGVGRVLRSGQTLGAFFLSGYEGPGAGIRPALASFVARLRQEALAGSGVRADRGLFYLLSSPEDGSACKRMNLFLRWMVRRDDGIDLGLWPEVSSSDLIMPLDTHTARIARRIGLLRRTIVDWTAAEELTARLRQFDPQDPVKYDFALSHLGSEGPCGKKPSGRQCLSCELMPSCRKDG